MEYIHKIDKDTLESLKSMLASDDNNDVELAIDIINKADLKDKGTLDKICSLISDYNVDIMFDFKDIE